MGVTLRYSWTPVDYLGEYPVNRNGDASGDIIVHDDGSHTPADTPVVLLLHGLSGDIFHFTRPGVSPSAAGLLDYDRSRVWPSRVYHGWRPYPNLWPIWKIDDDDVLEVEGYVSYLTRHGYRAATYAQVQPQGRLADPVEEAYGVLRKIKDAFPQAPIHLVAHSRGGLLSRLLLVKLHETSGSDPDAAEVLDRLQTLTTLGTPHDGSIWGSAMQVFLRRAEAMPLPPRSAGPYRAIVLAIKELAKDLVSDAYAEIQRPDLTPGNDFLTDLRSRETTASKQGLYGRVAVHTVGGTSTKATRVHIYWMDPISRIFLGGYHWWSHHQQISLFDAITLRDGMDVPIPETTDGLGDLLVGERFSRFAHARSHRTYPVNHAEELWDVPIKEHVLRTIGGPLLDAWDGAVDTTPGALPAIAPGRTRTVDVRVTNTGTSGWVAGDVRLETVDPGTWGLPPSVAVPAVPAGSSWSTVARITSPRANATYRLGWRLVSTAHGQLGPGRVLTVQVSDSCASLREEVDALDRAVKEAGANGEVEDLRFLAQERARVALKMRRAGCS